MQVGFGGANALEASKSANPIVRLFEIRLFETVANFMAAP